MTTEQTALQRPNPMCDTCEHGEYGGATCCEPCCNCDEDTLSSWIPATSPRCETCIHYGAEYPDPCDVCQDTETLPDWKPVHPCFASPATKTAKAHHGSALHRLKEVCEKATFVDLPELPGYKIGSDGTVISFSSNWRGYGERQMSQFPNKYGYMKVHITISGVEKKLYVHKLVAEAFLPPRPSVQHELRHLNGIRTDNRADNLAWGTRKENAADRNMHGNTARGSRNGFSKLTEDQVKIIKESSMSGRKLAVLCRVSQTEIAKIKAGKQWQHVM